jgi:hypothetical protein
MPDIDYELRSLEAKYRQKMTLGLLDHGYETKDALVLPGLQKHSKEWQGVELSKLANPALKIARDQIYKSAGDAATDPSTVPLGTLREMVTRSDAGHKEVRFQGSPLVWMASAGARPRRYVTALNLKPMAAANPYGAAAE